MFSKIAYGNQCDVSLKDFNRLLKKSKGHIFQSICLLLPCLEVSGWEEQFHTVKFEVIYQK